MGWHTATTVMEIPLWDISAGIDWQFFVIRMTWIFASVIFSKSISVPLIKSFIDITSERICHMYFHKTRTWSLLIAWLASNLQNVLQGILWLSVHQLLEFKNWVFWWKERLYAHAFFLFQQLHFYELWYLD